MKALATVLLALSLPGSPLAPPLRPVADHPISHPVARQARKGGQWYFAQTGHAVYCYGPVMMVNEPLGGFQRVATFCQGEKTMVPLKD
jgi:hypothetical protein